MRVDGAVHCGRSDAGVCASERCVRSVDATFPAFPQTTNVAAPSVHKYTLFCRGCKPPHTGCSLECFMPPHSSPRNTSRHLLHTHHTYSHAHVPSANRLAMTSATLRESSTESRSSTFCASQSRDLACERFWCHARSTWQDVSNQLYRGARG